MALCFMKLTFYWTLDSVWIHSLEKGLCHLSGCNVICNLKKILLCDWIPEKSFYLWWIFFFFGETNIVFFLCLLQSVREIVLWARSSVLEPICANFSAF